MNQQSIHDRIMSRNQGKDAVQVGIDDRSRPKRSLAKTTVFSLLAIAVVAAAGFAAMRYGLVRNLLTQPAVAESNEPDPALADTSEPSAEVRSARAGLANRQVTIR